MNASTQASWIFFNSLGQCPGVHPAATIRRPTRSPERLTNSYERASRFRGCVCASLENARDTLRWLGVFVHSTGNRVLFFPGFADTFKEVHGFKAKSLVWNQPFDFDHASLESDLLTWHITSARSEDHLGKPRTLDIGKERALWFGMSVADANALRVVREETRVTSSVPASDSKRRLDALVAARDGVQFPTISRRNARSRAQ